MPNRLYLQSAVLALSLSCGSSDPAPTSPGTSTTSSGTSAGSGGSTGTSSGNASSSSGTGATATCTKDVSALSAAYDTTCLEQNCCGSAAACATDQGCIAYDKCTTQCFANSDGSGSGLSACIGTCRDGEGGSVPTEYPDFHSCVSNAPSSCLK